MYVRSHDLGTLSATPSGRTVRTPVRTYVRTGWHKAEGGTPMGTALQTEDREQRLSRARAALAAERSAARWGGRIDRTALRSSPQSVDDADDGGLAPGCRCRDHWRRCSRAAACGPAARWRSRARRAPRCCCPSQSPRRGRTPGARSPACPTWACAPPWTRGWTPAASPSPRRRATSAPRCSPPWPTGWARVVLGPDLDLAPALWRSLLNRARTADTLVLAVVPWPGPPISRCAPPPPGGPVWGRARGDCAGAASRSPPRVGGSPGIA